MVQSPPNIQLHQGNSVNRFHIRAYVMAASEGDTATFCPAGVQPRAGFRAIKPHLLFPRYLGTAFVWPILVRAHN
jgi:hypothetical protein